MWQFWPELISSSPTNINYPSIPTTQARWTRKLVSLTHKESFVHGLPERPLVGLLSLRPDQREMPPAGLSGGSAPVAAARSAAPGSTPKCGPPGQRAARRWTGGVCVSVTVDPGGSGELAWRAGRRGGEMENGRGRAAAAKSARRLHLTNLCDEREQGSPPA